jgi:hypothetical protein
MTAGLPRIVLSARPLALPSLRDLFPHCGGFSMMDGSVRGSYDITYAKFGVWRYGARGRSRLRGSACC